MKRELKNIIREVNIYLKSQGIGYKYTEEFFNKEGNDMMKGFFTEIVGVLYLKKFVKQDKKDEVRT